MDLSVDRDLSDGWTGGWFVDGAKLGAGGGGEVGAGDGALLLTGEGGDSQVELLRMVEEFALFGTGVEDEAG